MSLEASVTICNARTRDSVSLLCNKTQILSPTKLAPGYVIKTLSPEVFLWKRHVKLRFKLLDLHDYSGHEFAFFFLILISLNNMLFTPRPKRVSDLGQAYNLSYSRQYKINL